MRRLWTCAGALLALAACGGSPPAPAASSTAKAVNTCATAKASKHLAYLVVEHLSGATLERCAGFEGDSITADQVMKATGIQYQTVDGSKGTEVCQIDHEPAQYATCSSPDQPHWTLWVDSGWTWTVPSVTYDQLQLHSGEGLGWRYLLPGGVHAAAAATASLIKVDHPGPTASACCPGVRL